MDWANERWIKAYTRETTEDCLLSWDAISVWRALLLKLDPRGRIQLPRIGDITASLAALVRAPLRVMQSALPELIECGRILLSARELSVPNFEEAQRARSSSGARQEKFRRVHDADSECDSLKKERESSQISNAKRSLFSLSSSDLVFPETAAAVPADPVDSPAQGDLAGEDVLTLPQRQRLCRHREVAERLWELQRALREEVAASLGLSLAEAPLSARALWPIVERLSDYTPEQCEMSLRYYASEARKKETLLYFNGQTNWRPEHVQRACSLARMPAKSKPRPAAARGEDRAPPEVMAEALRFANAL